MGTLLQQTVRNAFVTIKLAMAQKEHLRIHQDCNWLGVFDANN